MKIAYYCQHVLGVGHFHRSLEICKALSAKHDVTMIVGGAELDISCPGITFFQLPGLMMDSDFKNLAPCNSRINLDQTKKLRKKELYSFFDRHQPEVFLVELYPFGRKAFRFELDPVLEAISRGDLSPCRVLCSIRDILVERSDKEKFEQRIVSTLNNLFHGILIHGDEKFITLRETFSRMDDIQIPSTYTGYVTKPLEKISIAQRRKRLGIADNIRLVVASIGGGNVGGELLRAVAESFWYLRDDSYFLQIFTGPYADDKLLRELKGFEQKNVRVDKFTNQFQEWVAAADLSISMAGYNTCMNVLSAGTPALFYPFSQNHEQQMRVERLADRVPCKILTKSDLQPKALSSLITRQVNENRFRSPIDLDGAIKTVGLVAHWLNT